MFGKLFFCLIVFCATTTLADMVIVATETSGGDVLFEYSGSIDTSGLTAAPFNVPSAPSTIDPRGSVVFFGSSGAHWTTYDAGVTPAEFGDSFESVAASVANSGDTFAVFGGGFVLPEGYTGAETLSGSMTFTNSTFASLELTPGTYLWETQDDQLMTLNIGAVGVPEPYSLAMLSMVCMATAMRRRRCTRKINQ